MKNQIKITIYAIVENNNQILLTEDEGKPGWKLPGGEVEKGELLLEAVRREVKEETGFNIGVTGMVSIQEYIKENGIHRIRIYTKAKVLGGEEKLMNGEVKRLKWIARGELEKLEKKDFFIEPYYLAIREYLKNKVYPISLICELKQ